MHNRLAARNILITALMEVRIAGFGSEGNEDGTTEQPEAAGEAKAQAETRGEVTDAGLIDITICFHFLYDLIFAFYGRFTVRPVRVNDKNTF